MGTRVLVIGPPGTGKTEFDLCAISGWIRDGASKEEIAYVAYMRAAAADGAKRMGIGPEEAKELWFRTLHSTCYRLLGLRRSNVVTPQWLRGFGERIGLPVEEEDSDDAEEVADAILHLKEFGNGRFSAGTAYRRIYNLSRLMSRTIPELDAVRTAPHPRATSYLWPDYRQRVYVEFVERYERDKAAAGMCDFVDMLERVLREDLPLPRWRYAVVDELQDMTALQLSVMEKLFFDQCETVIMSGDDHQAIMTFQGSNALDFLAYRSRSKVIQLAQTHRFGQAIVDFSSKIAERIRNRHPREVLALPGKESRVLETYQLSAEDIIDGDLILHRHVSGCRELAHRLVADGIPFWNERGLNPLSRVAEIKAYRAWCLIRDGKPIIADDLQYLVSRVPSRKDGVRFVVHGAKKLIEELAPGTLITNLEPYLTGELIRAMREGNLGVLNCPNSEYYEHLEKNGYDLLRRPKTTITTIHGAKGRQASRVWLFSETYPKALSAGDDEHRVAYVGATRAQDDLFVVRENVVGDWTLNYDYPCAGE